jgi:hypothetical protein
VNFREGTNEGDGVESVADPHHRESVGKSGHQMRGIIALELNALIEVVNSFSKPQANNQKRRDTCRELISARRTSRRIFQRHTDHETKDTNPSAASLYHGPIKCCP